jgi:signal transduction histidine kinase
MSFIDRRQHRQSLIDQRQWRDSNQPCGYGAFTPYTGGNNCLLFDLHKHFTSQGIKGTWRVRLIWRAKMKQKPAGLSQRYLLALRKYFKRGSPGNWLAAFRLGSEGLALGLKPAGVTRIHQQALTRLGPLCQKKAGIKKGEIFLSLATMPFGETRRAVRGNKMTLNGQNVPANRHTAGENASRHSLKNEGKSLTESLRLQTRLRRLTHLVLAAEEGERKQLSCGLHDEIAQALLGINVRLLLLKEKARSNPTGLKKEIASTQRLVLKSAKLVHQFARELDIHRQTGINRSVIGL